MADLVCACVVMLLAMLNAAGSALAAPPASVGVVGPNVLVRPADAPTVASTALLHAAGNEFESIQVVIRAGSEATTGVDVAIDGSLVGPGGFTIDSSAVTIYRAASYRVTDLPSDGDLGGALGDFPDILIPKIDHVWGERRNAFPIDIPARTNRLAWIDVLVPVGAPAGRYTGMDIVVRAEGDVVRRIPVTLDVAGFDLPSTTSLGGGFDLNPGRLCMAGAHACASFPGGPAAVTAMYERVALDNRISIAKPPAAQPAWPANDNYRNFTRPLITGTAPTRLAGAKLTTVTIYQWATESADEWRRHAEADGFLDRVRFHCDEIATSATLWSQCRRDWQRANALWRGAASGTPTDLPLQVTTSLDDLAWARANGFSDLVDRIAVLIPVINRVHPKGATAFPGRRAEFGTWAQQPTAGGLTRRIWSYTSCMSMGCSSSRADTESIWRGWPSYGVDQPASEARAMGWISYTYGLSGEYYYETARDLPTAWTDLWSADGGNHGDGTLFYPGTVARIGGTRDIPLESIRMKRIRDGREDYEWLRAAASASTPAEARSAALSLVPNAFSANVSQSAIDSMRTTLAGLITGRLPRETTGGGSGTGTPTTPAPPASTLLCRGRRATIVGTNGRDIIRGTSGRDVIVALGGNDTIIGLGGRDFICAGAGNDTVVSARDGRARDVVACGAGRDHVTHDRADTLIRGCERRLRRR